MKIICFDNAPVLLQFLKENAQQVYPDADVRIFSSETLALHYAENSGCDILICEINPPRLEGISLAEQVKKINPRVNIIFFTVCSEDEYASEVMRLKPSGYLTKEATAHQIVEELKNLRYPVTSVCAV